WVEASLATTPEPTELQSMLRALVEEGAHAAIMEVSSHALTQRRVEGIAFRVGTFTNLTPEHLDYHGDFESYRRAKETLFRELEPGATAVLNADDPVSESYSRATRARVITYGIGPRGDVRALLRGESLDGSVFDLEAAGTRAEVRLPLVGRHNVQNALAAAASALAVGIDLRAIVAGLKAETRVPGRLEPVDAGQGFLALVDYAHTDDALRKVLTSLRALVEKEQKRGRILVVFGCGGDRDRAK